MMRRNLDFLAIFVALVAMAAIQKVPRLENRLSNNIARYQDAMVAKQSLMQARTLSRIMEHEQAIQAKECVLKQRILSGIKIHPVE